MLKEMFYVRIRQIPSLTLISILSTMSLTTLMWVCLLICEGDKCFTEGRQGSIPSAVIKLLLSVSFSPRSSPLQDKVEVLFKSLCSFEGAPDSTKTSKGSVDMLHL